MYIIMMWLTAVILTLVWGYVVSVLLAEEARAFIEERKKVIPFKSFTYPYRGARAGERDRSRYDTGILGMILFGYPLLSLLGVIIWPVVWLPAIYVGGIWYLRAERRKENETD